MATHRQLPKPGTYKARRISPLVVSESPNGALMAYVEYKLLDADIAFGGVHGICLGKTDGTLMTKTFDTLHEVFPAWATNDPFDLKDIEIPDGDGAEFILADCYIDDTYIPQGQEEPVLQFKARWFNSLKQSRMPVVEPDEVEAIKSKWSSKWSAIGGKPASAAPRPVKPPKEPRAETVEAEIVKPAAPKRGRPAASKVRSSSAEEVMTLLIKKHHPSGASDEQQQELGDKFYFPAQDELFGANVSAETAEQWGQVADKLGL